MRTKLGLLTALVAMSVSMTSCAVPQRTGHAKAGAGSSDQSSAAGDRSPSSPKNPSAPSVSNALNAKPFFSEDEICKIVNPEQVKKLGLTKPHVDERTANRLEISCTYSDEVTGSDDISVGFNRALQNGLSDVYARKRRYRTWQPLKVRNYPAVVVDKDAAIGCRLFLGVTDRVALDLSYGGGDRTNAKEACRKGKELAGMVISNLKLQE